jgi:arylsulfatase A-like enzyme
VIVVALLGACFWRSGKDSDEPSETPEPRDNLLILSIDTLRRDHVDRYATDGVERMPFLSSILEQGIALDRHRQCSNWTFHSMACTTLGRPVEEIGWAPQMGETATSMPLGMPTLAQRLTEERFFTLVRSSNGWFGPDWNTVQGYQTIAPAAPGHFFEQVESVMLHLLDEQVLHPGQRWLAHVHTIEPHAPYDPPEEYLGDLATLDPIPWDLTRQDAHYVATDAFPTLPPHEQALLLQHLKVRYDGELRWLDDQLRDAWEILDGSGLLDDTVVAIWTDHGEQFWEHGHQSHAWLLGPEEVDGILGFWSKGWEARAIDTPTHAIDFVPSALSYLGLEVEHGDDTPGHIAGEAPSDRLLFSSTIARGGAIASVTDDRWELVFDFDVGLSLYDLRVDPGRTIDLYEPTHAEVTRLWSALEPRAQEIAALAPAQIVIWPDLPGSTAGR